MKPEELKQLEDPLWEAADRLRELLADAADLKRAEDEILRLLQEVTT